MHQFTSVCEAEMGWGEAEGEGYLSIWFDWAYDVGVAEEQICIWQMET